MVSRFDDCVGVWQVRYDETRIGTFTAVLCLADHPAMPIPGFARSIAKPFEESLLATEVRVPDAGEGHFAGDFPI